jgi:hypothetical protein
MAAAISMQRKLRAYLPGWTAMNTSHERGRGPVRRVL